VFLFSQLSCYKHTHIRHTDICQSSYVDCIVNLTASSTEQRTINISKRSSYYLSALMISEDVHLKIVLRCETKTEFSIINLFGTQDIYHQFHKDGAFNIDWFVRHNTLCISHGHTHRTRHNKKILFLLSYYRRLSICL
jgi:hypothetical protein